MENQSYLEKKTIPKTTKTINNNFKAKLRTLFLVDLVFLINSIYL